MDSKDFINLFSSCLRDEMAFFLCSKPKSSQLLFSYGEESELSYLYDLEEMKQEKSFVFAPFNIREDYPIIATSFSNEIRLDISMFEGKVSDNKDDSFDLEEEAHIYYKDFDKFYKELESDNFYKLVLATSCELKFNKKIDLISSFLKAKQLYDNAFIYIFYTKKTGLWFGATPEILLTLNGDKGNTMALAGTQKYDDNIVWQEKNKKEQELVSQYIRIALSDYEFTETAVSTMKSGNLAHLRTDFQFKIENKANIQKIIKNLHPTPAVCGIEKSSAYNFILENESLERAYYTGLVGYIKDERDFQLYVNLRCASFAKDLKSSLLYAGGGLIKESSKEEEYKETLSKMRSISRSFVTEK